MITSIVIFLYQMKNWHLCFKEHKAQILPLLAMLDGLLQLLFHMNCNDQEMWKTQKHTLKTSPKRCGRLLLCYRDAVCLQIISLLRSFSSSRTTWTFIKCKRQKGKQKGGRKGKNKRKRRKRNTVWMSLLRYGGAEKLCFTARVSGGFTHSFGNMKK